MIIIQLFSLFGSILVDNNEANKSIAKTDDKAQKTGTTFKNMIGTVGKWGLAVGAAAGTAAIAIGTLAFNATENLSKALNGLQASTGTATKDMDKMKNSLLEIYKNNFGESFEDIAKSMQLVGQQTGLTGDELKDFTQNALMIKDTFGIEVSESVRSVNQLMKNFGISSTEAYNLLAQGAQFGLNANENLADTINEYSVHFSQLGLNAEDMFNSLVSGAQAGVFDIDKLGDAVKEFGIRTKDGSDATVLAFSELGLNAQQIGKDFAEGGEAGKKAFETVTEKINNMKDPMVQNQVGVALFGTMWEDVGAKGIQALTDWEIGVTNTTDALKGINDIKYNTFGEAMIGIKRQLEVGIIIPIGEKLLPYLNDFAKWITANMPMIQEKIKTTFTTAKDIVEEVIQKFTDLYDWAVKYKEILIPLAVAIGTVVTAFGIITGAIALWTTTVTIATTVGTAFGVVLAFITSPIGLVVLAITALIAVGVLLYRNWDVIKAKAIEIFDKVVLWIGEKLDLIKTYFSDFIVKVKEFGVNIVKGLWNGIQSVDKWIKDKIYNFVAGIGSTIKDFFGIASPSKLTTEYGKNISEGLAKGIDEKAKDAEEAAKKLAQDTISQLDKLGNAVTKALTNRYNAEERIQRESLNNQMDVVRITADRNIKQYDRELGAKLRLLNDGTNERLNALQNEIDSINALTDAEEKAMKEQRFEQEYTDKQKELMSARSADEKARIQEQLDEMLSNKQREVLLERRQVEVDNLREQQNTIRDIAIINRNNLIAEYDEKKRLEEINRDMIISSLQSQLEESKKHYEELAKEDNLQAEARRLALGNNQDELITLLNDYNPKWQDAGTSFGDSLLNGLNSKKQAIRTVVNEMMSMVGRVGASVPTYSQSPNLINPYNRRANGGNVNAGESYLVGEKGMEVFTPNVSGYITPNNKIGGNIIVNITGNSLMDSRDADKLGDMLVGRLRMLGV